ASSAEAVECQPQQVVIQPQYAQVNLTNSNVYGVKWGVDGSFIASDGNQDRFVWLSPSGVTMRSQPLNLLTFNLFPQNAKTFFNAFNANGDSLVGYAFGSNVVTQPLGSGFLNQGGALAVKPDESGISLSYALSALESFQKSLVLSPPKTIVTP